MDNQKPTAKPYIIGLILFLIVGLVLGGIITYKIVSKNKQEAIQEAIEVEKALVEEENLGGSGPRIVDLIGTGNSYTGEYVAYVTSSPATLFQFASSSDETYWDTNLSGYPNYFGATPTAAFLVKDAELVTFNFVYHILEADYDDAVLTCEFAYSNSAGCNNASSTLNTSLWSPIPSAPTTTAQTWEHVITDVSSFDFAPGAVGDYEWGITFEDINYQCMQLKCSNASTTATSTLWVTAALKEE